MYKWLMSEFDRVVDTTSDWRVDCPFCSIADTKQHMYVSKNKPVAHCFRCDWKGSHYSLVKECTGAASAAEVRKLISNPRTVRDYVPIVDRLAARTSSDTLREPLSIVSAMPEWYMPLTVKSPSEQYSMILDYALSRLSWQDITRHGIGYCTDGSLPLRMIIPIERGYYQARSILRSPIRKYMNPDMPIHDRVFNFSALDLYDIVYVCEGALSAIAVGNNAIAVLGKNVSKWQLARLVKSPVKKFVLAFDADTNSSALLLSIADKLIARGKEVDIREYSAGDPADGLPYKEFGYGFGHKVATMLGF